MLWCIRSFSKLSWYIQSLLGQSINYPINRKRINHNPVVNVKFGVSHTHILCTVLEFKERTIQDCSWILVFKVLDKNPCIQYQKYRWKRKFLERPITIEFYKNPGIFIIFAPVSSNIIEREFYQKKITGLLLIFSFFSFFFGIVFILIIFDESFSIISQKVIDQKMMISSLLVFYFSILLV